MVVDSQVVAVSVPVGGVSRQDVVDRVEVVGGKVDTLSERDVERD